MTISFRADQEDVMLIDEIKDKLNKINEEEFKSNKLYISRTDVIKLAILYYYRKIKTL